jgi:serine-type D-Ala-D-Ala endopeptidase (penicillin-binding protein 7)
MKALYRLLSAGVGTCLLGLGAMIAFTEPTPAETHTATLPTSSEGPTLALSSEGPTLPLSSEGPTLPPPASSSPRSSAWSPPSWFPEAQRDALWVLDGLDGEPSHRWGPRVNAHAGILADLDSGEILWARDPDAPRSIASVTKLVSSLTLLRDAEVDLDRPICVSHEQWPSRPGARSKFETGDCHPGWELLGAAMVASDNRGAFAMPAIAEEDYFVFVDRMHDTADDLRLQLASFTDPAGIEDENMASARDVLKAVTAVSVHPRLALLASAPEWRIETPRGPRILGTTNRLLRLSLAPPSKRFTPPPFETLAAKTGYTDTARYCFATVVRSLETGRRYGAVVLAAPNNRSRFDDVLGMVRWADGLR